MPDTQLLRLLVLQLQACTWLHLHWAAHVDRCSVLSKMHAAELLISRAFCSYTETV